MRQKRTALVVLVFVVALGLGLVAGTRWLASRSAPGTAAPLPVVEPVVPDPTKTVEGTLRSISDARPSQWTLDPQTYPASTIAFEVTADTEIITNGARPAVGLWARVELVSRPEGLRARTIELQPAPAPVTVEGPLTLVSSGRPGVWVIRNYPFVVDGATHLVTHGLTPEPGAWARAELVKLPAEAGGLARRRALAVELISAAAQPGPAAELVDRVRWMDPGAGLWQVGDTEVALGTGTPITGPVAVGDVVWVRGQRTSSGVQASSVVRLPEGAEVYFEGVVRGISGDRWQVSALPARQVSVDVANAVVEGQPRVGSTVRVYGIETEPGAVRGLRLWVSQQDARQEWVGWLQSMEAVGAVGLWRVGRVVGPTLQPVFLVVDGETVVEAGQGSLVPQAWLQVVARQESKTLFRAERVVVLPRAPKQTVQGVVQTRPEAGIGEWRVEGYRVVVTAETAIVGNPGVGSLVRVSGQLDYTAAVQAQVMETLVR
ncbi:MAG: DUF5666 domain-containing protein [Caldilineales bacterium]|nr:DUF5666 domain-containing protein [Caldilineales bacterium]MDW8318914.1 DUF5666 domain-containing protein [Anaerolineae bacterium]